LALLTVPGTPYSAGELSRALFQISMLARIKTSRSNVNATRAIAYILTEIDMDKKAQSFAEAMTGRLEKQIQLLENEVKTITEQAAAKVTEITELLKTKIAEIVNNTTTEMKTATQDMNSSSTKLAETLTKYKDTLTRPPTQELTETQYPPKLNPKLRAREGIKSRQILIDIEDSADTATLKNETTGALKEKVNKAIKECGGDLLDHKIKAITRLKNGGILMELDSEEAAEWIQSDKIRETFQSHLHKSTSIKPRLYHAIVQFVPLTLRPENPTDLRKIEESNDLEAGTITKARWIKPISRRKPSQTCGHLICSFSTAKSANETLANGLFICQKKVYAKKCKKEPLRCLKCHGWNHMASECTKIQDSCGTCAHNHRTAECTNHERPRCIPCNTDSHSSWDRSCPTFPRKCGELNEGMEENQMPYYPTREPWTQVREPPKTNYTSQPPRPARAEDNRRPGNLTQTTLTFQSGEQRTRVAQPTEQQEERPPGNANPINQRTPHENSAQYA
jgi:hypothetical protein